MDSAEEDISLEQLLESSSDESLPNEINPTNIDPRLEMYYAVYYDQNWYVGRVVDFPDERVCKGVTIVKPIVYGNIARYFGEKRKEDGHTHQWTVYVKPYHNEDMSSYVKKVHFKLHESYANPNRVVTKPPYEVTETGWGEFEIVIKIYFHDPNERPVTLYHILKLFQSVADVNLGRKTLVSEFYEEMVFQDPTAYMQHMLTTTRQISVGPWKHDTDFELKKEQTLASIIAAENKIRPEIVELKERLKLAEETISKFKAEIASASANVPVT